MYDQDDLDNDREERLSEPDPARAPGGLTWPVRRAWWFIEKHILWRISDSFKAVIYFIARIPSAVTRVFGIRRITAAIGRGYRRTADSASKGFRYRSPMAYIGATMLLTLTGAAIAAAVYFHNEAKDSETPVLAQVPTEAENVIAETPTPVPDLPTTPPSEAKDEGTLKGVVPNFKEDPAVQSMDTAGSGVGTTGSSSATPLPDTVVKPSPEPKSPPLKVAHQFAETFVEYEIGKKGAVNELTKTTTPKLSKELRADPPRQPSNGKIPQATVMNIVTGPRDGDTLEVSVSLMRSGATSELRLALLEGKKNQWLVSEVRG